MTDLKPRKVSLIANPAVVTAARGVMGGIDLDPYSTARGNELIGAARFYDREQLDLDTILSRPWESNLHQRVFLATTADGGVPVTRSLLHKLLREYRAGTVKQAVAWIGCHEFMTKAPWLWDFPVCIPFRRSFFNYWDDEVEAFRKVSPASWGFAVLFPPCDTARESAHALSKFHYSFTSIGRVILNQFSGEDDWMTGYKALFKKDYNFRA